MEEEPVGIRADHAPGKIVTLRQKVAVPVAQTERHIGAAKHLPGGHDIEHRKGFDALLMIERHAIGDPATVIMADDMKALELQCVHRGDHVAGHRPFRTVAVAAKISADRSEIARQLRRHQMSHHTCLRRAVKQKDGWSAARGTEIDGRLGRVDLAASKILENADPPSGFAFVAGRNGRTGQMHPAP